MTFRILGILGLMIWLWGCKSSVDPNWNSQVDTIATGDVFESVPPEEDEEDAKIDISGLPAELAEQIAEGYEVRDTLSGDLNLDEYPDLVMVLHKTSDDAMTDDYRRMQLYTGTASGIYQLAAENDKVVFCSGCGGAMGDPYAALHIDNGSFTVEHYGGASVLRWTDNVSFRYDETAEDWLLYNHEGQAMEIKWEDNGDSKEEVISTNTYDTALYGIQPFKDFDIYKDNK